MYIWSCFEETKTVLHRNRGNSMYMHVQPNLSMQICLWLVQYDSRVWLTMWRRGYPQNAGVLVVLVVYGWTVTTYDRARTSVLYYRPSLYHSHSTLMHAVQQNDCKTSLKLCTKERHHIPCPHRRDIGMSFVIYSMKMARDISRAHYILNIDWLGDYPFPSVFHNI